MCARGCAGKHISVPTCIALRAFAGTCISTRAMRKVVEFEKKSLIMQVER